MTTLDTAEQANEEAELRERRAHLLRLSHELIRVGLRVRVRKPRNGRWKLKVRSRNAAWSESVLCAGAEGVYAYVTGQGRLLGSTDDLRSVAQTLAWMIERHHR